ncbi:hypothetical protein [Bradyrhizobium sp. LVM 105]|uniref:hypothetical protein n=1 Tax=Bradyrhizobium sp. LVM 105 TaxID=2341115 RepID=UPI000F7FE5A9|nr:hypothetical protein [Bradyrhizobium sp. LVM 105]RTE94253.1 hypothetical protein D6B98_00005 [Bradyrhizobium sp. LVM 105]
MADGNVCKLRAITLVSFRRRIPFAVGTPFGGILEAPSYHSADRRPKWGSIGLIDILLSNGVKMQSRAAILPRNIHHKKVARDHFVLSRHLAKLLETKDFILVGAPGLEPGTR